MNTFMQKRKKRRELKECLHVARHARNMREDIADPADLARLVAAEAEVQAFYKTGEGDPSKAVEKLLEASDKVYPTANMTGVRENVEVIIVALGAAMAIRAFFFQPYKIPTGSMQPTLNGIIATAGVEPGVMDKMPLKFVKWIVTGESYKEIRAKASGRLIPFSVPGGYIAAYPEGDKRVVNIGGVHHKIPEYMYPIFERSLKESYEKGDVLASGKVVAGDHILVNKMKYNFMRPERGDISVFDTRDIQHADIRPDTFYIKRMVGMPNETIQIRENKYLYAGIEKDGVLDLQHVTEPPIFQKIDTDPAYDGHILARPNNGQRAYLAKETDSITLASDEYLMMGDNTQSSLDGRYFGGVKRNAFQGPAFFVYWPFREHWGLVK